MTSSDASDDTSEVTTLKCTIHALSTKMDEMVNASKDIKKTLRNKTLGDWETITEGDFVVTPDGIRIEAIAGKRGK